MEEKEKIEGLPEESEEPKILELSQLSPDIRAKLQEQLNFASQTVFRPIEGVKPEGRIGIWIRKKMINYLRDRDPFYKRFMRIHHRTKSKLLHPILRTFWHFLGDYAIKGFDDIPIQQHNNNVRMFAWCWEESLKDFWTKFVYNLPGRVNKEKFPTAEIYYKQICKSKDKFQDSDSHARRSLLWKIWVTEILEDTADREWLNFFMMRIYHTMHQHYTKQMPKTIFNGEIPRPGEYPMYTSGHMFNPGYFYEMSKYSLWKPPEDKDLGII